MSQNFIPEKAGKRLEGILLNKIVPELCALSLRWCPLFYGRYVEKIFFSWWLDRNPNTNQFYTEAHKY